MKKLILSIFLLLISVGSISAQEIAKKEIVNRDVVWSDFVGTPDLSSKFDAFTYWITTYNFPSPTFNSGNAYVSLSVRIFLRSDSWVKPGKKSARLLKHEQGHFRIGRICAKEIENTVNSTAFSTNNYHQEVEALYWKIIRKYQQFDNLYDSETEHFKNQTEQARWNKKLDDLLNQ